MKPTLNIKLLARVRSRINRKPGQFDICTNGISQDGKCGCIAGITYSLIVRKSFKRVARDKPSADEFVTTARQALGVPDDRLFFRDAWPRKVTDAYENADTFKAKAKVVCNFLAAIVETKKLPHLRK